MIGSRVAERVPLSALAIAILAVTGSVIAMGGMIRIYDAGESCPDWPTCFGTWGFDVSEEEQESWWEDHPDEIDSRGANHRYTTFEIFTEWFHRLLAGVVLAPMVALLWLATRKQSVDGAVKFASSLGAGLILWQGFLGYLTVRMDNEHWSVALHLVSALAFSLSMIWYLILRWRETGGAPSQIKIVADDRQRKTIAYSSIGALAAVFVGVYVSTTNGANYGCGVAGFTESWPLCQGQILVPVDDIATDSQIIHRVLVAVEGAGLCLATYSFRKHAKSDSKFTRLSQWTSMATFLFIFNAILGGLYVISYDPLTNSFYEVLSLIHLLLGSLAFLTLATAWIASGYDQPSQSSAVVGFSS